jgi:flagellar motor protein MotB
MAGKKEGVTIVIKKVQAASSGAHGGAWKVAFADFMTAMMCFFLVMWLMGADEETKKEISHYFNHPNTPYNKGRDPLSETNSPLGEKFGQGDTKFSMPGDDIFEEGSSKIRKDAIPSLDKLAKIFTKVQGNVLIEGHLDKKPSLTGEDPYLFSTERAIAVMNFFVKTHHMDEDRFCPRGVASRRAWSTNDRGIASDDPRNRRIEFTLSQTNDCGQ